jgi:hypothetical protein
MYSKEGDFIMEHESLTAAAEYIKNKTGSAFVQNISKVCNGKLKSSYGYVWKFKE